MKKILYLLGCILTFPHYLIYYFLKPDIKDIIDSDIDEMNKRGHLQRNLTFYLLFHRPYRNLFYYRIGHQRARWLRLFLKEYPSFFISPNVKHIGSNAYVLSHPYSTIVNAKSIGNNFSICQLTTIGNKRNGRNDLVPSIGDNVTLGANVNIIGEVTIGNNVIIGAGSVVVKDVPDNCIIAGNPAKIIKYLTPKRK